MNELIVELKWRLLKIGYKAAEKFEAMDEQEQEAVVDTATLFIVFTGLYPLQKRYYAKRGAPKWVVPALWGIAIRLEMIERSLRRSEKQAVRERKQ